MARLSVILIQEIPIALATRMLRVLTPGVIAAVFLVATVLGADAPVVLGVLAFGCLTTFVESAHNRTGKPWAARRGDFTGAFLNSRCPSISLRRG